MSTNRVPMVNGTLEQALAKLSLKNGDIVFCDRDCIDAEFLMSIKSASPEQDDVLFVLIDCRQYESVSDAVHKMSREELKELIKE